MMRHILFSVLLAAVSTAYAETFSLNNLPESWAGSVEVAHCAKGNCSGVGKIRLNTGGHSHVFDAEWPEFPVADIQGGLSSDRLVTVDDFNFDGRMDIAVPRGLQGPYGSLASDIYLQTDSGSLVKSLELSELTDSYMGMPATDHQRKLLIVGGKAGAAVHYTAHYRFTPNRGLQLVYQRTDTHGGCSKGEGIQVEEKAILPGGRWRTSVRCLSEAQYESLLQKELAEAVRRRAR